MASGDNWKLEVYEDAEASPIATREFDNLATLRIAIIESQGKRFIVQSPSYATAADRNTLLDLRSQGFDISMRSS